MKYTIIIEETVSEELTLEAENKKEALEEARRLYRQGGGGVGAGKLGGGGVSGCIGRVRGCWSREIWWK